MKAAFAERGKLGFAIAAVMLVVAASAARVAIEHARGVVHADSDLLALFIPTFAWWWARPRGLGGWNPWVFGGYPANADPQVAALHPLGLLYAIADPLSAATIDGVITPALGGIGMLVYLRAVGSGSAGAVVGALSFALGGYFTGHAPNPGLMRAAMVVPWALAAIEVLDGRALVAAVAAAMALLVLSGHPQGTAYALALVLAYGAIFGRWRSRRRALLMVAGLTLGVCLTAGMLLPAEELVRLSSRAYGGVTGHANPKLSLAAAMGLFIPFPRGGAVGPLYGTSLQFLPGCGLVECSGYPGTVPLLVVLASLPSLLRTGRGRFWLVCSVLGVVLATGVFGAGSATLRAPVRFLLWWSVAIPAAAGLALRDVATRPTLRASMVASAVFALLLGLVWTLDPPSRRVVAGSFVVLAVASVALVLSRRSNAGSWVLVALTCVEMIAYVGSLPFGVTPESYRAATIATGFLRTAQRAVGSDDPRHARSRYVVVPTLRMADWAPFSGTLMLQGYNSLLPARSAGLLGPSPGAALAEIGWVSDPSLVEPSSHVLDLMRADVVAVPAGAAVLLASALDARVAEGDPRWAPAGESADRTWRMFVNRQSRPLGWMVYRIRPASAEEARTLVRDDAASAFDPALQALVHGPLAGLSDVAPTPAARSSVRTVEFGDDEIRLEVETSHRGLLVTSELDYPGWTALVDGRAAAIETVNAGFRAVVLEPGQHDVVFAFRPWRARVGMAISAASALLLLALVIPWRRRVPPLE